MNAKERKEYIARHLDAVAAFEIATGLAVSHDRSFPVGLLSIVPEIEKYATGATIGDLARAWLSARQAALSK